MIFEDINELAEFLEVARVQDPEIKVLTTCGGFAPLHIGHTRCILETAKMKNQFANALCVIIVNGNEFLESKKGFIFMDQKERMEIIHSLKGVDHVTVWYAGTQNCIGAIKKIKPSIFTKGGDRDSRKKIPESQICDEVGCKIVFGVGGNDKPQSSSWLTDKIVSKT